MPFKAFRNSLIGGASACLLLALAPAPAAAGALNVDPVRVEISAQRKTASVTVRNEDGVPVTIRAYSYAWSQADGEDVYEETNQVIVSPPIFTIPAGGTQVIRVGLRNPAAERKSYRLMIEEIPEAIPAGGVQVALRLNLPLFAMVQPGSASDLAWSAWRDKGGNWVVEAANRGAGYVRVEPADAAQATGLRRDDGTHFGVVLPGSSRRWQLGAKVDVADPRRFAAIERSVPDGRVLEAR